jgi:hypothetical protein
VHSESRGLRLDLARDHVIWVVFADGAIGVRSARRSADVVRLSNGPPASGWSTGAERATRFHDAPHADGGPSAWSAGGAHPAQIAEPLTRTRKEVPA